MSHSQQELTAFKGTPEEAAPPDQESAENANAGDFELDIGETEFSSPDPFPQEKIHTLSSREISINLCTKEGTVSPTFQTIAGTGGMGADNSIANVKSVFDTTTACIGLPVLLTGGGMSTPMGSGAVLGRLLNVEHSNKSVTVELQELYQQQGTSRQETRNARLGAYELSLPQSASDCQNTITALSAWENNEIDYLDPIERQKHELIAEQRETFTGLSPADKVQTPEYASRLEVVSEPFETHAVIPRGTLSSRTVKVVAVTVNNPNGGYYQLGFELETSVGRTNEIPTCYLSTSTQSPPTPNTAFTRDAKFSSTELEVTPIKHPPNPEIVPPDEEVLNSPLAEPRLRTSIDKIDGIGEKTGMKLHRTTDNRVSAESVAYTMFGDGDIHSTTLYQIEEILSTLPQKEKVYDRLKNYIPEQ